MHFVSKYGVLGIMGFKDKKFRNSVAFLAFLTSVSPVLFQNIEETKVFADGISEEVLNKLALLLEFIFRKFADGKK